MLLGQVIFRFFVAAVFALASAGKIYAPMHFAEQIQAYQMVPIGVTHVMAFILPWLEMFVAVLYLLGIWKRETRWLLIGMLAVFVVAKSWVEVQGYNIDCGCFGWAWLKWLEDLLKGVPGIIFNLVLIALLTLEGVLSRPVGSAAAAPGPARAAT